MSLTELLLATQDPRTRAQAEAQIKQAEQANVEQYFTALAQELANAEKPVVARQLAGLLLKNGLAAKDLAKDRELKARWASLPAASRNLVKEATTTALVFPQVDVGKAAAQVLAKIGAVEIPPNEWPGLVPLLLQHVTNTDNAARQISLVCLGYLCEELVLVQEEGGNISDDIANNILTAVVQGMKDSEPHTKLEATRAFYHAVVLAKKNFKNQVERDVIMSVMKDVCCFQAAPEVQIAAFECLVQIATEYYDFLLPYMNSLGFLTLETIKSAPEKVAIPAMEFWSTICDEELFLMDLIQSGQPAGGRASLNLIQQALPHLVPLLTETLTRRQSEDDDDTWNLAMAAGTCLALVAQVVGDGCVDLVLQFVTVNFNKADWKFREAAVLAYGSIMEGPTSEKMRPMVESSLSSLVVALQDPSVAVRDTIAWTLGRIAQFHPTIVPVKQLMPLLCEKLRDVPRVSANICWNVQVLAEAQAAGAGTVPYPDSTVLSEFFTAIAMALLEVVARPDADERQLRMAGYNALSVLVSKAGNDCLGHMQALTQEMLKHLQESYKSIDRECELQGYICGVLTSLVSRLRERIAPLADKIMEEALKVISAYQQVRGGAQVLHEEALLLIVALANAAGSGFDRFMPHFAPHLTVGLQNYEEIQVCLTTTRMVGDLCTALESKVAGYCDMILEILYTNLKNPAVDRKIKAAVMTCFGDIAMAITGDFEKYLGPVVQMLREASSTRLADGPADSEEWIEYLNSLREGVLEAYSGIIHGLKESGKLPLFKEHVNTVLMLVKEISEDQTSQMPVIKAAVGVVGDLILVFQTELTAYVGKAPFLSNLVQIAIQSQEPKLLQNAQWLQSMLVRFGG
ncbi:Importin subunit beta-1 (Karyopherin subunit beta-1) (ATKPNB1) [Durusdinium trenchii]|uniref:Importin subunit beta-1 (Karyopherin subunit beta-1) (ATKPNB1) n=1 Tax=Durusdinium trenchii TaxID=1381693 RepID=A0ABP0J365_9DINO